MGSRLLRSEMLDSESVLSLPVEARWLFVTILLSADDLGIFEATSFRLARKADINRDIADKLLTMICDSDLIRLYEVDGKRFGFIPKFRQRIRLRAFKHPLPPKSLMLDDEDALNKINELPLKVSATCGEVQTVVSNMRPKAEAKAKAEAYINTVNSPPSGEHEDARLPKCEHQPVIDLYHKHLPTLRRVEVWNETRKGYLRQRWREVADEMSKEKQVLSADVLEWFSDFFQHIGQSRFLTGRVNDKNGRAFAADLEWIIKPSNFAKIVEGKYHGTN